jgi:FADH2-dependent halogenase
LGRAPNYDVIVVGGGPAGSLVAAGLAACGLATLIVERTSYEEFRWGEFLSPHGKAAIDKSGVLEPGWEKAHAEAWEFASSWGSANALSRNYLSHPYGHALVLDRVQFDRSLAAGAQRRGATIVTGAHVTRATQSADCWRLAIGQNYKAVQLNCSFLVVCAGRTGPRLRCLQTRRHRIDKLVCFGLRLANYRGDVRPLIESYENGWTYSAGLPSGELMINLCTEQDEQACRRISKSLAWLIEEMSACSLTRARIVSCDLTDKREVKPFVADASSAYTRPVCGPGWCLAGDHAQSMDPLSSSGIAQATEHADSIVQAIGNTRALFGADLQAYRQHVEAEYRSYLTTRAQVYGLERRWPTPFWRQRSAPGAGLDPSQD